MDLDSGTRLVEILSSCGFDRTRLTSALHAEVFDLARAAGIELHRVGAIWASSPGADMSGGEITRL